MSEYIYRSHGEPLVNERGEIHLARAGAVVRCRDCINYSGEDSAVYPKWCMAMNTDGIEPDGFCAWAERRDA